jgi:hypothetical protein
MSGDLVRRSNDHPWLVAGWFTPDYGPRAKQLASSLDAVGAPYHLWSRDKVTGGWDVLRKAAVVLQTMDAYPGKTLVLMDVDCVVRGDIAPATNLAADVALTIKPRLSRNLLWWQRRLVVTLGSRVMVFRPTEGARSFAQEWDRLCAQTRRGRSAEIPLAWAFLLRPDLSYAQLDKRYAGREVDLSGDVPSDAVICHDRAHGKRTLLQAVEQRLFRKGRTKGAVDLARG